MNMPQAGIWKVGDRMGRLTLLHPKTTSTTEQARYTFWVCKCDCGKLKELTLSQFGSGNWSSCGCINTARLTQEEIDRGIHLEHPETYVIWLALLGRAERKRILVEDDVKHFTTLLEKVGPKPANHRLCRIDRKKHFYAGNLVWRETKFWEYNGEPHSLTALAKRFGRSRPWFQKQLVDRQLTLEQVIRHYQLKEL